MTLSWTTSLRGEETRSCPDGDSFGHPASRTPPPASGKKPGPGRAGHSAFPPARWSRRTPCCLKLRSGDGRARPGCRMASMSTTNRGVANGSGPRLSERPQWSSISRKNCAYSALNRQRRLSGRPRLLAVPQRRKTRQSFSACEWKPPLSDRGLSRIRGVSGQCTDRNALPIPPTVTSGVSAETAGH